MNSYDAEPTSEQSELETGDEIWADEEELHFAGVDERLWSNHDLKQQPPPSGEEVGKLADEVEIGRLMDMRVLVKPDDHDGPVQGHLTTKFVRDWQKKVYVDLNGGSCERWMRRSRLVAREYANTKRDDTFSPATGAHTSNLLPVFFLDLHKQAEDCSEQYKALLASLDIKDAFLQVPQTDPTEVSLWGSNYVVLRNLPGQRRGSKMWYDFFRSFLEKELSFEFCAEQPCLARVSNAAVLIHVDDLLYAGSYNYFHDSFLKACKEKFVVNVSELAGNGSKHNISEEEVDSSGRWNFSCTRNSSAAHCRSL